MASRAIPAVMLVILGVAGALAEPAAPPSPSSFLPSAEAPKGLPSAGPIRTYARGKLWDYLNGGADVIEEFGVEQAAVREWTGEKRALAVLVYRMKDDVGACGVATYVRGPGTRVLNIGDGGYETDHRLGFHKGRWYAQFDVQEGGKEVLVEARRLARETADRMPGRGAEPAILEVLRAPTMVRRSEVLLRGPLALATAEPFAGVLATEDLVIAGAARYRHRDSHARLLVAEYASEDAAKAAFGALARELGVVGDPGTMIVVKRDEERVVSWPDGHMVRVVTR